MTTRGDIRSPGEPLGQSAQATAGALAGPPARRRLQPGRARLFGWLLAALSPALSVALPAASAQAPAAPSLDEQLATLEAQIRELEQGLPTATPGAREQVEFAYRDYGGWAILSRGSAASPDGRIGVSYGLNIINDTGSDGVPRRPRHSHCPRRSGRRRRS